MTINLETIRKNTASYVYGVIAAPHILALVEAVEASIEYAAAKQSSDAYEGSWPWDEFPGEEALADAWFERKEACRKRLESALGAFPVSTWEPPQ